MKTNRNLPLWKKNKFFLSYIIFAFFAIVGWQVSESSAQDWATCVKPVNIPEEIDVLEVNDEPIEKTITNETDDDWFQYYFTNEEDDTNPDPTDTNGEDHGINIDEDEDVYIPEDLSWEVYDRNGICVSRGKSGDRFGPSLETLTPPPGADPLPSDIYFIRVIWDPDPEDDIEFEEGDERFTYSLTLNGTGVPRVDGFIKDAFSGDKLENVNAKNNKTEIHIFSNATGYYALDTPDGNNPLDYDRDGYNPLIINDFIVKKNDLFAQNVIMCPNDVVLTATPTSGDAPLTVTFGLPDVTNPEVSAVYDWDFGDGMSSDSPDPGPITYSVPGTKNVEVTVTVTLPTSDFVTEEVECTVTSSVDVIVINPDEPGTFADVPEDYWAYDQIEAVAAAGITSGCDELNYCPDDLVTRAQMSIFLERAMRGSNFVPPAPQVAFFDDVPTDYWAAAWVEQLAADGISGGCGGDNFCPNDFVNRAQMAVFLEKAIAWPSPANLAPATGTLFDDVPLGYWADDYIEQLANDGISGGCGGGNYCPEDPVDRATMAVFIVRAFGL